MIAYIILGVAVFGMVTSTIVFVLAVLGAIKFRRSARLQQEAYKDRMASLPPVSVLKPVHGIDARMRENIAAAIVLATLVSIATFDVIELEQIQRCESVQDCSH